MTENQHIVHCLVHFLEVSPYLLSLNFSQDFILFVFTFSFCFNVFLFSMNWWSGPCFAVK